MRSSFFTHECPVHPSRWFSSAFWRGFSSLSLFPSRSLEEQVNARLKRAGCPVPPVTSTEPQDVLAKAWEQVGQHMRSAMAQVEEQMPPDQKAALRRARAKKP